MEYFGIDLKVKFTKKSPYLNKNIPIKEFLFE